MGVIAVVAAASAAVGVVVLLGMVKEVDTETVARPPL
jgi:hypothetical protein